MWLLKLNPVLNNIFKVSLKGNIFIPRKLLTEKLSMAAFLYFDGRAKGFSSTRGEISSNLYRASVHCMTSFLFFLFFYKASFCENYSIVLNIYANPNILVYGVTSQVCISSNNNTSNSGGVMHWRWSWIM